MALQHPPLAVVEQCGRQAVGTGQRAEAVAAVDQHVLHLQALLLQEALHVFGVLALVDQHEAQVGAGLLGRLQGRHLAAARRAPSGPEVDHQRPTIQFTDIHRLAVEVAQRHVRQLAAALQGCQQRAAAAPERGAHQQGDTQGAAYGWVATDMENAHQCRQRQAGQEEEAAVADIQHAPGLGAVLGEIESDEGETRRQHPGDQHGEQGAFGVGASFAPQPPATAKSDEEAQVEKRLGGGKGDRADLQAVHRGGPGGLAGGAAVCHRPWRGPAAQVFPCFTGLRAQGSGLGGRAVLQCLGQVLAGNGRGAVEIGEGAGDLDDAVCGAQRQAEAFAGVFQPATVLHHQRAVATQALEVEKRVGAALAIELALAGLGHGFRGAGTVLATGLGVVQGGGFAGDGEVQVDAVEQRAGELGAVALDLFRGATARVGDVTQVATGAGVHGGDQLEARREAHPVVGPGDDDLSVLQGLAQDFEDLSVELRQLVEEQHALVGQGDFARAGLAAAVTIFNRCNLGGLQPAACHILNEEIVR